MVSSGSAESGSHERDVSTLAAGATVALVGRVAGQLAHLGTLVVVARGLGAAALGLYSVGWTLFRLLGLLASLGLPNGVIRFGGELDQSMIRRFRELVRLSLGLAVGAGAVAAIGWLAGSAWLAEAVFGKPELLPVFRGFSAGLPLAAALVVAAAASRVSKDMRYSAASEDLGQPLVALLAIGGAIVLGLGIDAVVWATVGSFGAALLIALLFLRWVEPPPAAGRRPDAVSVGRLLAFSLPTAWASLLTLALIWVDRLFIAAYRPIAEAGIYQAVSQLTLLFVLVKTGFNAIFLPMIAELLASGRGERLESLYRVSTKWGIYCSIPPLLVLTLLPVTVLELLFGADFGRGGFALALLSLGQFLSLATGAVGYLLIMSGRQMEWLLLSALALGLDVVLNVVLIPVLGLVGAAWATAVAMAVLFGGGLLRVRAVMGLWPYDRRFRKLLPATALGIAGAAAVRWLDLGPHWVELSAGAGVATGLFALALVLAGRDDEDRLVFDALRRRGLPRRGRG